MKIGIVMTIAVLIAMTGVAVADKQPGAVMAVNSGGLDQFYPTTDVYIKGVNLAPDSPFTWAIYDKDVTCPPESVLGPEIGCAKLLHSGTGGTTDGSGEIVPYQDAGWSIPNGDYKGHHYKLIVTIDPSSPKYADVYTKVDSFEPIPEASTMVLTSMGIFGVLFISRKYGKK